MQLQDTVLDQVDKISDSNIHKAYEQALHNLEKLQALYVNCANNLINYNNIQLKQNDLTRIHLIKNIMTPILALVDDLSIAISDLKQQNFNTKGFDLILEGFLNTLSTHNIRVINPKPSDIFNAKEHEAITAHYTEDFPDNTINKVILIGYKLDNSTIIRAAKVIVNKTPIK